MALTPGHTFVSGEQVTAAKLNNLVANAVIPSAAIGAAQIANGSITTTQINAAAGILFSQLEALTDAYILVGNGSDVAAKVAVSGDMTLTNAGALTINAGAVDGTALAAGAVIPGKVAAGAIDTAELAAGAVELAKIGVSNDTHASITLADGDGFLVTDGGNGGTEKMIPASDIKTYAQAGLGDGLEAWALVDMTSGAPDLTRTGWVLAGTGNSSAINTTAMTITTSSAHGIADGDPVCVSQTFYGLDAHQLYYAREISTTELEFYDTYDNANAAPATTGRVTITGSHSTSINIRRVWAHDQGSSEFGIPLGGLGILYIDGLNGGANTGQYEIVMDPAYLSSNRPAMILNGDVTCALHDDWNNSGGYGTDADSGNYYRKIYGVQYNGTTAQDPAYFNIFMIGG